MKAAILKEKGQKLQVTDVPIPEIVQGSVRIKVLASHVLSFAQNLFSGNIPVPLPTPYIPGPSAIGVIDGFSSDAAGLEKGQLVFCSPYITGKEQTGEESGILKGWFGLTPNSGGLLDLWKQGSFAEMAVYPTENVTPIPGFDSSCSARLSVLNYLCIAYGGLLKGNFRPGQSVLVNGATGNLGAAATLVALAMGASEIYAAGRNTDSLESLRSIAANRIIPIELKGSGEDYSTAFSAIKGKTDLVLDTLGTVFTPSATSAAIATLRNKGAAVLIGGVFADIPLNYYDILSREIAITGSFMYPATAPKEIIHMIRAGTIDLENIGLQTFGINEINEAIVRAAELKCLNYCVLIP